MPDGRFLSKSIAVNGQLARVSLEADYLFSRCIPHLDRDGRMNGEPAIVVATVCPLRPEITPDTTPDLIRQLAGAGLVRWYRVGEQKVLEFPGFRTHQRGMKYDREAASRLPAYDSPGSVRLDVDPTPDEVRTDSGLTPDKVRDVAPTSLNSEVNLSESKTKGLDANASSSDESDPRVRDVFAYWVERTGRDRGRTKLTDNRRRVIRTRLRSFSVADLRDAIDGVMLSDHHSKKPEWTDLTSCFASDEKVENHLERSRRNRGPAPAPAPERKQVLRDALAMVRRQDPHFTGGLPDLWNHSYEVRRPDYPLWDEVLKEAGLQPIPQEDVA